jgi:hypothetical protein
MSPMCVSATRTSRPRLGQRTRVPRGVRALAAASLIRPPRPHIEARRTAPSRTGHFSRKRICHGARVSAIKAHSCGSRPSTPRSAARHCCHRLALASASVHRRPTIPLSSLGPVAPPQVAHCHPCAFPSPESVRPRARRRGPVAAARPNPAAATNRLGVSLIAPLCYVLPWSGPTSPSANSPAAARAWL